VAGLLFSVSLPSGWDAEALLPSFRPFRCGACPEGKRIFRLLAATLPFAANAADAISGAVQRQPTNWQAIVMFLIFVIFTLGITYWASKRVRSRNDYYTAGGNITGFQNGLAIAGDYMSAASFLGISALVFTSGYDGLPGRLANYPVPDC